MCVCFSLVITVIVMRVLLFVLHVCMLREDGRGVVVASAGGTGILSVQLDMLWMSVVCGMRGVGGVCEMCMCLARGGVVG